MFSFLKKLFNIQKTDINPVKEDQRMKLESNHDHIRLENLTIKDNDLDKSCKSNESNQKVELNKCNNFYSNETASFSSETKAHESFDNQINTIHKTQKVCRRLAPKKIFYSNETASSSLETKAHESFDDQINTTYKSQRRCSRLAAKKIKKVVEELSLYSDDSNDVIDEIRKQETSENPKLLKNQKKLCKRTIRFCHKCKKLKTIFGDTTKRKNCNNCGSILLYLCTKCEEKHYVSYKGWSSHEITCNGNSNSQKLAKVRNKSASHQCPDCDLKIFDEKSMRFHSIVTKHTAVLIKKPNLKDTGDEVVSEGAIKKANNKKVLSDKSIKLRKFVKWIKRYCETCQKIVPSAIKRDVDCKTCSTLLQFQCAKCDAKYNSLSGIHHHLKTQCFLNHQKSIESKFRSTNKRSTSSIQHIRQTCFKCDMCTYQSEFKHNLKRHIEGVHLQQNICCQNCPFKTKYRQNLRRHERQHLSE